MLQDELKKIPAVDKLLLQPSILKLKETCDSNLITNLVRNVLTKEREEILSGSKAKNIVQLCEVVVNLVNKVTSTRIKPVINATGIMLHTNLGRAPLGSTLANEIIPVVSGYSNLEFDLFTTKRGKRTDYISEIIKIVTGAEDTEIVNNNAAAIILTLKTFAERKEVIVSRSELIEIGGSFRIPEIMKASGAYMVEVGTTNRTSLEDYEKSINENTRIIFKAHKSNYYIKGFTGEVELKELSSLAQKYNLILMYDIGSGLLKKLDKLKYLDEPDVKSAIKSGADIVTFSCDKLMGGPQAGIITGKKDFIDQLSKSPLMRALRVDKITIAMLSSILRLYLNEDELYSRVPVFNMLGRTSEELFILAQSLYKRLENFGIKSEIIESKAQCGGGSLPQLELGSYAVKLNIENSDKKFTDGLYKRLLRIDTPVLSILREGNILFDVLTIQQGEINTIAEAISSCINKLRSE